MEELRELEKDFAKKARKGVMYMHKTYSAWTWYMNPYLNIYRGNTISSKLNHHRYLPCAGTLNRARGYDLMPYDLVQGALPRQNLLWC